MPLHPTLKFTCEISKNEVTFLDLIIYKGKRFQKEGKLDTRVATKKTDTFQYLARDSAHPKSVFGGLIEGETLRYARNYSHWSDFEERVNLFKEHLAKRGYAQSELDQFTQMKEGKTPMWKQVNRCQEVKTSLWFSCCRTFHKSATIL